MQKVQQFIKNKYILMAILVVAVLGMGFVGTKNYAKSDNCAQPAPTSPQFDVWPLSYNPNATCVDLAQIDAFTNGASGRDGRFAESQAEHDAGIHANVGDTVTVSIYFHNGASDQVDRNLTTAHNVSISSSVNAGSATDHTFSSSISASNAATVSSASRGGSITVHTGTATTVSIVPGSAGLCITPQGATARGLDPNTLASCGVSDKFVPMSDSIFNGSVSIGDLEACFPFSGTLDFKVQFNNSVVANGALSITKQVEDLTAGQSTFSNSTNAKQGDQVQYQVVVTNSGNATVNNVILNDPGASGLQASGSGFPSNKNLGSLAPGQSSTVNYSANVTASSGTIPNTATASGTNVGPVSATANVFVNTVIQNPSLAITKQVTDVTTNGTSNFSGSTNARQGDVVEYRVTVTNNGSGTANNVVLSDPGANGLSACCGSSIPISTNLGNFGPGQSQTIFYEANVVASGGTITNTATASSTNAGSVSATANVFVFTNVCTVNCTPPPQTGSLFINKQVRNISFQNILEKNVNAFQGDHIEFQITVQNNSSSTLNNVILTDSMPFGFNYTFGSTRLDGNTTTDITNNQLFLGQMFPGQQHTIIFDGTATAPVGTTVTNTAFARADNAGQVSDSASFTMTQQILGSNVNLVLSKSAFNETKNIDATATPASKEDFITYTLTVQNTGNAPSTSYVVSDDLSNVLNLSTLVDNGGGTLNGNVISWPGVIIQPGQTVTEHFRVRVNFFLPTNGSLSMTNTFGNTVIIPIQSVAGAIFVAPKTGSDMSVALGFGAAVTAAFALIRNRSWLAKLMSLFARA